MRGPQILLVLLILAPFSLAEDAAAPAAPETPPVVTLREAVERGLVSARGVEPASYREVTLRLENLSGRPLSVDICGSHLIPRRRGSCQRLGIGPPITPNVARSGGSGTIVVDLEPEQKRELRVNTVCLDAGRPGPGSQVFEGTARELPPVRVKVLRWWADNPTAPQSAVNCAIWRFQDTVDLRPGVVETYRTPRGRFPAVRGGTYYRLVDGELLSLDPTGIRRVLGTEIFQALPAPDGVYAVGLGENRQPELWRLALTGREAWTRVMDLDATSRLLEVFPVGKGKLAVVTDRGVAIHDRAEGSCVRSLQRQQILDISVRDIGRGPLVVTLKVPAEQGYYQDGELKGERQDLFEVWTVDRKTGEADLVRKFWNVKAVLAGEAGIYGLSHAGSLRRLAGKTFKTLSGKQVYSRIVAVGRATLWLATDAGKLAAADARTGALRRTYGIDADGAFAIDKVTDDLALVREQRFLRIRAGDGEVEEVSIE